MFVASDFKFPALLLVAAVIPLFVLAMVVLSPKAEAAAVESAQIIQMEFVEELGEKWARESKGEYMRKKITGQIMINFPQIAAYSLAEASQKFWGKIIGAIATASLIFMSGIIFLGIIIFGSGVLLIILGHSKNFQGFAIIWEMFSTFWFAIFVIYCALEISDLPWIEIIPLSILGFVVIGKLWQGVVFCLNLGAWRINNAGKQLWNAIHGNGASPKRPKRQEIPSHKNEHMPNSAQDAFAVLGLNSDASRAEIKKAYRKAIMQAHPDRGGTHAHAIAVNTARKILRQNGYL